MNHPPVYWPLKNLWSVLYGGAPMYRISGDRVKRHAEEIRRTYTPPPCPNVFAERGHAGLSTMPAPAHQPRLFGSTHDSAIDRERKSFTR
jgi:hypothetical protein